GERVSLAAATPNGAGFLFASAERIEEPIVRYGPFVMNTEAEIHAAIRDYQMGVLHR
ncbi:MAG: pirin family protein, partial [Leptospiraceae bacterium]|nr:pirin family protein [Leptospiraceae bacterium]